MKYSFFLLVTSCALLLGACAPPSGVHYGVNYDHASSWETPHYDKAHHRPPAVVALPKQKGE